MLGAILPIGKAILMGIGGLSILGSVVTLAGRRGNTMVDFSDYTWLNADGEYVEWDELDVSEQKISLRGVQDGSIGL